MHPVTREEADAYARSGEPLDKAGSYALQGEGTRFVSGVAGSRSNVIGLPLKPTVAALRRAGVGSLT
jgi:septum formation protein